MDEKDVVSRVVLESVLMHASKANKRITIICVIFALAFILSNLAWIIHENQFEVVEETTEEYEVSQENSYGGTNNFNNISGSGEISNG